MTRVLRVSDLKGNSTGHRQTEPKPGTKLRALWDALQTGEPVHVYSLYPESHHSSVMGALEQLQLFYGLEVERVERGVYRARN